MKKYFLIVVFTLMLFTVTGCGKKQVVCSKSETVEGKTMSVDVIIDLDENDKATGASMVYDFGDKETAETYCELLKQTGEADKLKCSGSKVTVKDIDNMSDEEEDSEKITGKTKEEFVKEAEAEGFTCK